MAINYIGKNGLTEVLTDLKAWLDSHIPTKTSDLTDDTVVELTKAQYDALGSSKLTNNVSYYITDED